jgi:hypothetical protein
VRVGRAGVLLAVLMAAGCSSGAPPQWAPRNPNPVHSASTAATFTAATPAEGGPRCPTSPVVGQALGMALGEVHETFLPQSGVVCDYDGMRTAVGALTGVSLSIGKGVDAARFAGVRASYAERGVFLTDLSAIGDEAFTLSTPAPGLVVTTVIVRKADTLVTLSAQATLEQELALVRMIIGG